MFVYVCQVAWRPTKWTANWVVQRVNGSLSALEWLATVDILPFIKVQHESVHGACKCNYTSNLKMYTFS